MIRITAIALVLVLAGFASLDSSEVSAQAGAWTALFDGKTLEGWNMVFDKRPDPTYRTGRAS